MGAQHTHISLYLAQTECEYHARCIQTTVKLPASVQVCGAISNRGQSHQRNVNGNMDSANYQSDIIHDIEMTCEYVVFLQKEYIFRHDLAPCNNSKSTRIFLDCNYTNTHSSMRREFAGHESHRKRLEYNEERYW